MTDTLPRDLRVADLVAKLAGIALKDTMRVMAALDALSLHYDCDVLDLLEGCDYMVAKPEPENIAACEQEAFAVRSSHKDVIKRLRTIRELARTRVWRDAKNHR